MVNVGQITLSFVRGSDVDRVLDLGLDFGSSVYTDLASLERWVCVWWFVRFGKRNQICGS